MHKPISIDLLHSFSNVDGMAFGDIYSVQMESGRVYYEVKLWFQDKEEATQAFNKYGGEYVA